VAFIVIQREIGLCSEKSTVLSGAASGSLFVFLGLQNLWDRKDEVESCWVKFVKLLTDVPCSLKCNAIRRDLCATVTCNHRRDYANLSQLQPYSLTFLIINIHDVYDYNNLHSQQPISCNDYRKDLTVFSHVM